MITTIAIIFWCSIACIVYTYAGYPLLLILMSSMHQVRSDWRQVSAGGTRRVRAGDRPPSVAVLVAAYNEEQHIGERIRNLLGQDYPPELLRIYVGSDCSSDRTAEICRSFDSGSDSERLTFVEFPARRGKASVINDLAAMATEDILVFTDANTSFRDDVVKTLMRHFGPADVACVCGELLLGSSHSSAENQDHIYWRYERLLKFFESRIGALLGANGGVYALRRKGYVAIPANTVVDDFWISMQVVEAGGRCVYDPEAVATETTPDRIGDEFRRRVRIGMGNYQAFKRFVGLLDPRRGAVAVSFFSHKCLRWLVPHCMVVALASNLALVGNPFYACVLALQIAFYAAAWVGWWRSRTGNAPKPLRLPLFFVSMNLGLLLGFWKFATAGASGTWTRSAR
jgi:cellulose synthase/poly-beta-1,6-N-acetylglucosamine synthase-like glycosyltransferase